MNENRKKVTCLDESGKKGIVFVADNWGKFTGGIDVINQKLCEAMGYVVEQSKVEVICLVIVKLGDTGIENQMIAQSKDENNVIVVPYVKGKNQDDDEVCEGALREIYGKVTCHQWFWIGHDIKTGFLACMLSKKTKGKSAVILHTDYYVVHQRYKENGKEENYQKKYNRQRELINQADYVFCVGYWGKERFKNIKNKEKNVIIPGLEEKYKWQQSNNHIMISGRFNNDIDEQKNWKGMKDALFTAFSVLRQVGQDILNFPVFFVGFDSSMDRTKLEKLENEMAQYISDKTKINPYIHCENFYEDRDEYLEKVSQSGVLVMASETESFGLVAWEALAMGVPLVVSQSSGVYKHLENKLGYLMNGLCATFKAGSAEMNENIGRCIADLLINNNKMEKATSILRKEMSEHKWETVAIDVARKMKIEEVMDETIFCNLRCYEFAYATRALMFEDLKRRIANKTIKSRILFFEGVSRDLIGDKIFSLSLLRLISEKKGRNIQVYLCYGSEDAIGQRVTEMKKGDRGVLQTKAKDMESLKIKFKEIYTQNGLDSESGYSYEKCAERIHLVPLKKSPSVYINILDNDWYFTQKFENRTSENTTVKIANGRDGFQEKQRIVNHMKFILDDTDNKESKKLSKEIEKWLNEGIENG